MASNLGLTQTSQQLIVAALMHDKGSPAFIEECQADFYSRMQMINKRHDPEVSKHNLAALRNGKFNFITTGEI